MTETKIIDGMYGNWRRPKSAGVMGLDLASSVLLFSGVIFGVLTIAIAGLLVGVAFMAVGGCFLATMLVKDRHGRNGLQRLSVRVAWRQARWNGSNHYRSGPLGKSKWGTHQLPGLLASTKLNEYLDSWGQPFGVIELPSKGHFAVSFGVEPEGSSLVDFDTQEQWVAGYAGMLKSLGELPGIIAAVVTIETVPDTGRRLAAQVTASIDPNAPQVARDMLLEVVDQYPTGSARINAYVTLTFDSNLHGKRLSVDEFAAELKPRMMHLSEMFRSTGVGASHPLSAAELCEIVRSAYDPDAQELIEAARVAGEPTELDWSNVGPSSADAYRDHYRHENALSVTWEMSIPPRGMVRSTFLRRLLEPSRQIERKRVSIIYRVLDPATAARVVEADKRAARFNAGSQKNPSTALKDEVEKAEQTASEESRGAGLVNFALLVTATVRGDDHEARKVAESAVEALSATARLTLRKASGSQDSSFAANLPCGIVLSEYVRIAAAIQKATV